MPFVGSNYYNQNMALKDPSRRRFIKQALGGSSLVLAGCSSFDSVFTTQKRILDEEVLIVGAGAAGLAAAYELKRNNRPFRLFEAGSRLGGRVYSVQLAEGLRADLGAEFISSKDSVTRQFLKDFGVKTQNWRPQGESFHIESREWPLGELRKQLSVFVRRYMEVRRDLYRSQDVTLTFENAPRFDRVPYYDSMSVAELLAQLGGKDAKQMSEAFRYQFELKFGVSADRVSSLHFINEFKLDGAETLIVEGGLGSFFDILSQRVVGTIPDFFVRSEMQLIEISENPLSLELVFKRGLRQETYFAKQVILALPPSQLINVKGFANLEFSTGLVPVLLGMQSGRLIKGAKQVKDKASTIVEMRSGESLWRRPLGGEQSLVVAQSFNEKPFNSWPQVQESGAYRDWSRVAHSSPGSHFFAPGNYARGQGIFSGPLLQGKLHLAGDYTSLAHPQSIEGALSSGLAAARSILSQRV